MADLQQLIKNIEQWAEDHNLIKGSTPRRQKLKLMEEFGELCGGIAKNKPDVIKDSIGGCFIVITILNKQVGNPSDKVDVFTFGDDELYIEDIVTHISEYFDESCLYPLEIVGDLQIIAKQYGLDFKDCVQYAYNQVKNRKGKMVDGFWIKELDLQGSNHE